MIQQSHFRSFRCALLSSIHYFSEGSMRRAKKRWKSRKSIMMWVFFPKFVYLFYFSAIPRFPQRPSSHYIHRDTEWVFLSIFFYYLSHYYKVKIIIIRLLCVRRNKSCNIFQSEQSRTSSHLPIDFKLMLVFLPFAISMNRFQTVLDKAESYLIATKEYETVEKLAFADKFRLNILLARYFWFFLFQLYQYFISNARLNARLLSFEKIVFINIFLDALSELLLVCGCSSQARGTYLKKNPVIFFRLWFSFSW